MSEPSASFASGLISIVVQSCIAAARNQALRERDHFLAPLIVRLDVLKHFAHLVHAEIPRRADRVARRRRTLFDIDAAFRRIHDHVAFGPAVDRHRKIGLRARW